MSNVPQLLESFVEKTAQREFDTNVCYQQIMTQKTVVWSWGAKDFGGVKDLVLIFRVNGRLHKGMVLVTLGWEDLYAVHLFTEEGEQVGESKGGIYAEDLVWEIDALVETPQ